MNRKMFILTLVLAGAAVALGFTLRARWMEQEKREQALRMKRAPSKTVLAPPAMLPPKLALPSQYFDVASKTLFSKDRNPTVVLEPAPPPPPPPPMPDLPAYHGQMSFGEDVAFLSTARIAERGFRVGESIGDFKLVRFDRDKIAFEWQGKTVEKRLEELRPKEKTQSAQASANVEPGVMNGAGPDFIPGKPAGNAASSAPRGVRSLSGGGEDSPDARLTAQASDDPLFGPVRSDGTRECVASDASPSGSVHNGYRKYSVVLLVGLSCYWEKTK
jgi:hypothetical protein